ncbi:phosphate transport system permease protein [Actinobacillus equuli]|nr:phosphate transport system permease protein [Actinobacillus equuli]
MELGFILFLITTVVLSISRLMILRMTKKEGNK